MKHIFKILLVYLLIFSLALPAFAETKEENGEGETKEDYYVYSPETGFPVMKRFSVDGTAALLCSLDSDMILYAQEIDRQIQPASLAKIMTVLVAVENGNLDDMVTVSNAAMLDPELDGWSMRLSMGEVLPLRDLLYLIMLKSVNEACNAVAEHIAGSVPAFVEMLNARAQEMGLTSTHFANAHGLKNSEEYTTCRDLMNMTKIALQNPVVAEICYAKTYMRKGTNMREEEMLHTENYLIDKNISSRYYYSYAQGIKAGFLPSAGRSCITVGDNGQIRFLAIVTGCKTTKLNSDEWYLHNFSEIKKLLEYGFENFQYLSVFREGHAVGEVDVENGVDKKAIVVSAADGGIALPKGYNATDVTISVSGGLTAPSTTGDIVGTATVSYRGIPITTVSVTPLHTISKADETKVETPVVQRDMGDNKFPTVLILLVIALVLLLFYLFIYINNNIQRSKKKRLRRKKKKLSPQQNASGPVTRVQTAAKTGTVPRKRRKKHPAVKSEDSFQ